MSSLVIVAIPEQTDEVWKISSEKIPHMTLCFLGEADQVEDAESIVQFVEHAAALISPFWMEMDYRGVLGPDEADVLFFEKGWDFATVERFRNQLLQNKAIKAAYNSVEQYDEWTPHLTLGYPKTPAKETDRTLFSVRFDRIGVWMGDYEGPEFRLKNEDAGHDSPSVSMSAEDAKTLLHYGTKGMKWGVRKNNSISGKIDSSRKQAEQFQSKADRGGPLKNVYAKGAKNNTNYANKLEKDLATRQARQAKNAERIVSGKEKVKSAAKTTGKIAGALAVASADAHWRGSVYKTENAVKVHNNVADRLNGPDGSIAKLNSSPKYRGKNLNTDHKLKTEYEQDFAKVSDRAHQLAVKDVHGKNYSGTQKAVYVHDVNGPRIEIHDVVAKHEDNEALTILLKLDENGQLTEANTAKADILKQGEDFIEDQLSLMHYGVKGMRWGHRSSMTTDHAPKPTPGGIKGQVAKVKAKAEANRIEATKPVAVKATPKLSSNGKAKVVTEGGKNQPAHPDAIQAAVSKQQLHTSGLNSLSNKELQTLATRLNLEQQINRLEPQKISLGQRLVKKALADPAKAQKDLDESIKQGKQLYDLAQKAKK